MRDGKPSTWIAVWTAVLMAVGTPFLVMPSPAQEMRGLMIQADHGVLFHNNELRQPGGWVCFADGSFKPMLEHDFSRWTPVKIIATQLHPSRNKRLSCEIQISRLVWVGRAR